MTFPTCGSCGAAGADAALGPVGLTGEGDGAAEEGRDQPGPVVVERRGVAVSLVVIRRE